MRRPLRVGISTCPNDTFAFAGLLTGAIEVPGYELDFQLADVEELNRALLAGELDIAKASFHAALPLAAETLVLPSGSALGFGVGPVTLAANEDGVHRPDPLVLCPGAHTTATLLHLLFHPEQTRREQVVFSDIVPRLVAGSADHGVCIHEGRFTYEERGLSLVEDLGARWEATTGAPLPLGGILGRRRLGLGALRAVQDGLARSLAWARADRRQPLPVMREHAQELEEAVLWAHVDLYVNEWTTDLGEVGRAALATLGREARRVGLLAADAAPLEVLEA